METMIHIQCGVAIKDLFKNVYDVYHDVASRVMDNKHWRTNLMGGVELYNACDDIFVALFKRLHFSRIDRRNNDWVEEADSLEMRSNSQLPAPIWSLQLIRRKQGLDHLRLFATG